MQEFAEFIDSLDSLRRFSRNYMAVSESVLNHTATTALIASYILESLEAECPGCIDDRSAKEILTRCLVHDIDEIASGDIIRTVKYDNPELTALLKDMEARSIRTVLKRYLLPPTWGIVWRRAKDDSLAGRIITIADFLSVAVTCYREIYLHSNRAFQAILPEVLQTAQDLEMLLDPHGDSRFPKEVLFFLRSLIASYEKLIIRLMNQGS